MILSGLSNASYLNLIRSCSRASYYIFLYEDAPVPHFNGSIFTMAQIIKFVTSSATESELSSLFICAKNMVPIRNNLVEMGWLQPLFPIHT